MRYHYDADDTVLVPVFADFRGNLPLESKVSPYLSLGIGYSFDATESFEGVGFMLNPTVGINFKVTDKSAMNIGLGYEMQKVGGEIYDSYYYYSIKENLGAISINVGISF